MQRQLALAAPAARHPFRRNLVQAQVRTRAHRDDQDIKLFALSFTAFFICIYTFIF
uniref:hypothetical protein n=1 Tax=Sphingomonas bacterium TaxID=1895847 RepID=UPI002611C164|nr:hypothetical protein [Sphingomonas bacterium]